MSAWLVTKEHIDVIVTAGIVLNLIDESSATATGDDLWTENAESLRSRYGDAEDFWALPNPGDYQFSPRPTEDLYYVAKELNCYTYQSCEHPGWSATSAHDLCDAIEFEIIKQVGTEYRAHPNYQAAPWGVDPQ